MGDDQHSGISKEETRKDIEEQQVIHLVQEADSTSEKAESIYSCYEETSWKPQDLHRLPDKTIGRLKEKLEKNQPNCSKSVGARPISTPMYITHCKPPIGRTHLYGSTLSLANVHLTCAKGEQFLVPPMKKYHSEMDLNGNTQTQNIRAFQHGYDVQSNCSYSRREPKVRLSSAFCSEIELNALPGLTRKGSYDAGSIRRGSSATLEYNGAVDHRQYGQPVPHTRDFDACSTASSVEIEARKSEKALPRNRRSKRQLPPTPSVPSRIVLKQGIPCLSRNFQPDPGSSGTLEYQREPRRQMSIDEDRFRGFRPHIGKSISLPEQYPLGGRRKAQMPLGRFHSWSNEDRRVVSLSNLRSPSVLSYASSLDLPLYTVSDSSSESELSSGGESIWRIFEQARREGLSSETRSLQTSTTWDAVSESFAGQDYFCSSPTDRSCEVYIVKHCYTADGNGEISLVEGEEVLVMEKSVSGWWFVAKVDQQKGWVPSNFLRCSDLPSFQQGETENGPESPHYIHCESQDAKIPEETDSREKELRSVTKSPERMELQHIQRHKRESGALTTHLTMNRSVKFLTVEGIQKRKDPEKNYVYVLKVVWSDGTINIIYRKCSDFFRLQEDLKKQFADAIGGSQIPALKGRKFSENCKFCFKDGSCKRMSFLNQFCHELINAQVRISRSDVVLSFCKPNYDDLNPQVVKKDKKKKKSSGKNEQGAEIISSPVVFEQHIVVADYKKKCKNDINLDAGDIVDVIEQNEYGWWLVDREGELGWAPASYLEPMDELKEDTITTQKFGPGEEEVYMSIKEHKAEAEDEVSFDVGVMLQVLQKTLDGWWLVRYHGREGWAPAMVLKKVDNNTEKKKKISVTTGLRSDKDLDIVAFTGEIESGSKREFMERTPPARRYTVRRTIKQRPKYRVEQDGSLAENPIMGDLQERSKSRSVSSLNSYHSNADDKEESTKPRSGSTTPNYSPSASPRTRHRALNSQTQIPAIPKNLSHGEIETFFRSQHLSASSSGYDSSPWGSTNSLGVNGMHEDLEERPCDTMSEQVRSIPRRKLGMRRIHSSSELTVRHDVEGALTGERGRAATLSTSMAPHMSRSLQRMGHGVSLNGLNSTSRPVPLPRKISHTKSPLASQGSPERRPSPKGIVEKSASLEREKKVEDVNSVSDYESSESDTSEATVSELESSIPKEESIENTRERAESSPRTSECQSPTEDAVFNGESQQEEANKENQPNNKQEPDTEKADSPRYRATSCYFAEDEGELRFNEGEIIEVIEKADSGWWYLKAKDGVGWGPSTYLEALDHFNDDDTKL